MKGYLLVYTDYEGLEVIGLHSKNEILKAYNSYCEKIKQAGDIYRNITNYNNDDEKEDQYYDLCEKMNIDTSLR